MGKKGKKSRFNQVVDIDFTYSSTSVVDGGAESALAKLNLSREKVTELQRIKAQLPSAPQAVRIEEEIAQIPDSGPFRIMLANVAYQATREQIEEFLLPIIPTQIKIVEEDGRCKGFGFVDFASRADLTAALDKNGNYLSGRRVTMRIAANQNDRDGGGAFGSGRRGGSSGFALADPGGWSRRQRDPDDFHRGSGSFEIPMEAPADGWRRDVVRPSLQRDGQPAATTAATTAAAAAVSAVVAPPPSAEPLERPVIRLISRTRPIEAVKPSSDVVPRNPSIFGEAKPVDTAAREREIEQRIMTSSAASEHKPLGRVEPASPPGGLRAAAPPTEAPSVVPAAATKPQAPPVNAWSQRKQQQQQHQKQLHVSEPHPAAAEPKKFIAQPQQPPPQAPQQPKPQANAWKKPLVTAGDEPRP
uniref:RRM domain-containing protein n=1 Tax=Schistocephalus solidus TaxID=70667 RepID=A0A0X3PID3_SCHSO